MKYEFDYIIFMLIELFDLNCLELIIFIQVNSKT